MGGGGERQKGPPTKTSFSPITSTNVGTCPKNYQTIIQTKIEKLHGQN